MDLSQFRSPESMPWPDVPEPTTLAGWISALLVAVGAVWRGRLKVRREARGDQEAVIVDDGFARIIKQQQAHIDSMARDIVVLREGWAADVRSWRADVSEMRQQRDDALGRAWTAESDGAKLRARVSALEDRLGIGPAGGGD